MSTHNTDYNLWSCRDFAWRELERVRQMREVVYFAGEHRFGGMLQTVAVLPVKKAGAA